MWVPFLLGFQLSHLVFSNQDRRMTQHHPPASSVPLSSLSLPINFFSQILIRESPSISSLESSLSSSSFFLLACISLSTLSISVLSISLPRLFIFSAMDFCAKSVRDSSSPFDCIIFDLDDTLYSSKTGIGEALKRNIDDFLVQKFGFSAGKASALRVQLFKAYGSSLAGLRATGYDVDADDYHSFVHGKLPYDLIKPDPQLRNLLLSINQRKIIFTNSDRIHATKALNNLGISDCFEQIICFETMNPNLSKSTRPDEFPVVLKPSLGAMDIAIDVAEVDPHRTLFLDDNAQNIAAGKAVGLRTVLVGKAVKSKEADYAVEFVNNLVQVVPEIRFREGAGEGQRIIRTRNKVDSVLPPTPVGA